MTHETALALEAALAPSCDTMLADNDRPGVTWSRRFLVQFHAFGLLSLSMALLTVMPAVAQTPASGAVGAPATPAGKITGADKTAQKGKPKAQKAAASAKDDDDDDDDDDDKSSASSNAPPDSWPTTYLDLETGWTSTPGNTVGFGPRQLRFLTGSKSRGFYMNAPLTIDLSDRLSIYAGVDGATSQTLGDKWATFTSGSWNVGGSAEIIEQSGLMPGVTISASVSRPFEPIALGAFTTTWTTGIDLDYALNKDETRGLTAGLTYTRTMISAHHARVGPQLDGYLGAYWSPSDQVNVTTQIGVQYFGGAEAASIMRLKPVATPYIQLEVEHVNDDDDRIFAVNLMLGWSPKPMVQLSLSTPLYLAR